VGVLEEDGDRCYMWEYLKRMGEDEDSLLVVCMRFNCVAMSTYKVCTMTVSRTNGYSRQVEATT
jgi:hypothetical protein